MFARDIREGSCESHLQAEVRHPKSATERNPEILDKAASQEIPPRGWNSVGESHQASRAKAILFG